jgi:ectoine hydroxylase-related dioxygenase (phytanoyl-CoA dioxygenase family)
MKAYGITEAAAEAADPALALALEELARNGFTILADALPGATVATMRDALDRAVANQAARFGGTERLAAIGEAGQARALLEEEPVFLDILRVGALDAIVSALLGPAALVMQQNGIVMPPEGAEHHQQSWHRDLPYQAWVASKPIALGALTVLDDFTAESGATLFLPGSQRHADFPSAGFASRWAVPAFAPAGAIVVFDAMCFHRGGVNRGRAPRRAVNTLYGVPLLAQQVLFTPKPGLEPALARRLGLDYQAAPDVDAWREKRAARLGVPR